MPRNLNEILRSWSRLPVKLSFLRRFFFKKSITGFRITHAKNPRNVSQLFLWPVYPILLYYQEERLIFSTVLITFLSYWIMAVLTALRTYISMYYSQQPTSPYHSSSRCMLLLFSVYCRDIVSRSLRNVIFLTHYPNGTKQKGIVLKCFALNTKLEILFERLPSILELGILWLSIILEYRNWYPPLTRVDLLPFLP